MNKQELELEKLVNQMENTRISVPPLFELFTTTFSIAIAILFFSFPEMIEEAGNLYEMMLAIMPQSWWAISFFIACMTKAIGLLWDKNALRIIGLVISVCLYLLFTICYAANFPTIGSVLFGCMTLFAIISIPFVKHTSIIHKRRR